MEISLHGSSLTPHASRSLRGTAGAPAMPLPPCLRTQKPTKKLPTLSVPRNAPNHGTSSRHVRFEDSIPRRPSALLDLIAEVSKPKGMRPHFSIVRLSPACACFVKRSTPTRTTTASSEPPRPFVCLCYTAARTRGSEKGRARKVGGRYMSCLDPCSSSPQGWLRGSKRIGQTN